MKKDSPCYGCEDRHAGCHGTCEKYAGFIEGNKADRAERKEKEGGYLHSAYTRTKKAQLLDKRAKQGYRRPNYMKGRYH